MTDWYRIVCYECGPNREDVERDHFRGARFPDETHVTIQKSVHDRKYHDTKETAEVVEE